MAITKVEDFTVYQNEVLENEKVVLKFEADWCYPCKAMVPALEEFSQEHPDVKVLAIDVEGDGFDDLLKQFEVRAVPTFVQLKQGSFVKRIIGAVSKKELSCLFEG